MAMSFILEKPPWPPMRLFKLASTRVSKRKPPPCWRPWGLTVSDAVRLLLTKVAHEKALPFELLTPNEETIAAMKEARRGGLASSDSVDALMNDLNAKD